MCLCVGERQRPEGLKRMEIKWSQVEAVKQVRMPFVSMFTLTVFTAHGPCSMKSLVRTTANASARRPSTH